ncbi:MULTISPECIES: LLM class flavin-dependent oxidoreductase [unclassified Microbacterium]|uniref:LLM class flavin-dependent oxidoreductase n=1 Tax=unclassified Microbacterium TaxID=2609290 RepID=UPI0012FD22E6|nr:MULTISPECIES: LLM class flavin-dependent oxidoreductase [unclassified Microbacterium]
MRAGVSIFFQNLHEDLTDRAVIEGDLRHGVLAEELGFDWVSVVEHHFDSYSMSPDNMQILAYLAGKTSRIGLQTGAVILPWHDPLRVAERVILLDEMSGGRLRFGVGRGLAKMEYDGFRTDMDESRERFDESLAMIMRALDTGIMEGDGKYYPQPATELRPRPSRSFTDRMFMVAMSPDSARAAAEVGLPILLFPSKPLEEEAKTIAAYRESFEDKHGRKAPPAIFSDISFCHEDAEFAAEVLERHQTKQYSSFRNHYSYDGDHFGKTKGYESYAESAKYVRETSLEDYVRGYNAIQATGTPEQVIAKIKERVEVLGKDTFDMQFTLTWGGIPYDLVDHSMKLLAREVLPAIRDF